MRECRDTSHHSTNFQSFGDAEFLQRLSNSHALKDYEKEAERIREIAARIRGNGPTEAEVEEALRSITKAVKP